jgi:CRP/FNR family transcriptional regulator, cyclic AMP receptor protein
MSFDTIFAPILQLQLFSGLTPAQLKAVALGAERVEFADGEVLLQTGEEGDAAYVLLTGEAVRTEHPLGPVGEEVLKAGTMVGEMAMLIETVHTSTIVARGPVLALKLSRSQVAELLAADTTLADYFADRMRERLDVLVDQLRDVGKILRLDANMEAEAETDSLH